MRKPAIAAAVTLGLAAPAFAQKAPDLILKKVTEPPATVTAGDDVLVKAKVKNAGTRSRGGKVKIFVTDGPGEYALPRRVARFSVAKIDPGFFKRYTVRVTVPGDLGAGRYRLQTCLFSQGTQSCADSKRFTVRVP